MLVLMPALGDGLVVIVLLLVLLLSAFFVGVSVG